MTACLENAISYHDIKLIGGECWKMWKQLRSNFVRVLEKEPSGAAAKPKTRWPYFNALLFLKDSVKKRATTGMVLIYSPPPSKRVFRMCLHQHHCHPYVMTLLWGRGSGGGGVVVSSTDGTEAWGLKRLHKGMSKSNPKQPQTP